MSTVINYMPQNEAAVSEFCDSGLNPQARAFVELALLVLYARQTPQERKLGASVENNGMGFDAYSARNGGTYYAEYVALGLQSGKPLGSIIDDKPIEGGKAAGKFSHLQGATRVVLKHAKQVVAVLQQLGTVDACKAMVGPCLPDMAKRSIEYHKTKYGKIPHIV